MRSFKRNIQILFAILFAVLVASVMTFNDFTSEHTLERTNDSPIEDFTISVGGFGATACTVSFEDGSKVVKSGSICWDLERGAFFGQYCKVGPFYSICFEMVGSQVVMISSKVVE